LVVDLADRVPAPLAVPAFLGGPVVADVHRLHHVDLAVGHQVRDQRTVVRLVGQRGSPLPCRVAGPVVPVAVPAVVVPRHWLVPSLWGLGGWRAAAGHSATTSMSSRNREPSRIATPTAGGESSMTSMVSMTSLGSCSRSVSASQRANSSRFMRVSFRRVVR